MELITYNFSKVVLLNYIMVLFYIVYIKTSIKKMSNYDPHMVLLLYYISFYISRGFVLKNIVGFSQLTRKPPSKKSRLITQSTDSATVS